MPDSSSFLSMTPPTAPISYSKMPRPRCRSHCFGIVKFFSHHEIVSFETCTTSSLAHIAKDRSSRGLLSCTRKVSFSYCNPNHVLICQGCLFCWAYIISNLYPNVTGFGDLCFGLNCVFEPDSSGVHYLEAPAFLALESKMALMDCQTTWAIGRRLRGPRCLVFGSSR